MLKCSICGSELGEDAVTFTAGDVLLLRPCGDCSKQVRQAVRIGSVLGARKLKATLEERVPHAKEIFGIARKAMRVAQVITEEEP